MQAVQEALLRQAPVLPALFAGVRPLTQDWTCEQWLRILPGKRWVGVGLWGQEKVVAKIYLDDQRANRHLQREIQGLQLLHAKGLAAPDLLAVGELCWQNKNLPCLLLRFIPDGIPASQSWSQAAGVEQSDLLEKLVLLLADHHHAGIMQKDLHWKNFFATADKIYTLDGADIVSRRVDASLGYSQLGLLLAQLPQLESQQVVSLQHAYEQRRGLSHSSQDKINLPNRVIKWRLWREKKYIKKIFRDSSAVCCERHFRHRLLLRRDRLSDQLGQLLAYPDWSYDASRVIKQGHSATLWLVPGDLQDWIVKRYNIKGVQHGLRRALVASRAAITWQNSFLLAFYQIATPCVLGVREERLGPVRRRAWLVQERLDGVSCRDYLLSLVDEAAKLRVAERIVVLLQRLYELHIVHGDMKANNIWICDEQPFLIDLDSMHKYGHTWLFKRRFAQDMGRFLRNWEEGSPWRLWFEKRLNGLDQ